jgi:hypothetical protein
MGVGGFLKTVGKVAYPMLTVAAQAGGPFTAMAAQQIGKALGLDKAPDATPEAIEAAMSKASLDPATQLALAKGEQDFAVQMETLTNGKIKNAQDFEAHLLEIDASDRASARDREKSVKDKMPMVLGILMVSLATVVSCAIVFGWSKAARDTTTAAMVGAVVGYVFGEVKQVYNYYFGSSAGSDRKTELLAESPAVER